MPKQARIGWMWKAIVAGVGSAVTSITAIEAGGELTWQAIAIAAFGAIGTALATFAKSNVGTPPHQPKPEGMSQQIPGYQPPMQPSGLPTAYPR